jgi:hypothetical protein
MGVRCESKHEVIEKLRGAIGRQGAWRMEKGRIIEEVAAVIGTICGTRGRCCARACPIAGHACVGGGRRSRSGGCRRDHRSLEGAMWSRSKTCYRAASAARLM